MSDEERPFYAPNGPPARRGNRSRANCCFEFYVEAKHMRVRCELRTHSEPYGVEAQFLENEVFMIGRRFDPTMGGTLTPREMAVQWAHEVTPAT